MLAPSCSPLSLSAVGGGGLGSSQYSWFALREEKVEKNSRVVQRRRRAFFGTEADK